MEWTTADLPGADHDSGRIARGLPLRDYGGRARSAGPIRPRSCEDNALVKQVLTHPGASAVPAADGELG